MRALAFYAWVAVSVVCCGCGPKGPVGRLLKASADAMKEPLKTIDRRWPDMDAAERLAWHLVDPEGERGGPPNVYWKLPEDIDARCHSSTGSVGFADPVVGGCLAGLTLPIPHSDGSLGLWILAVRQTPTQPPSETALYHEYLHAALLWAGAPWPHHSQGDLRAPAERDVAFFEEVNAGMTDAARGVALV